MATPASSRSDFDTNRLSTGEMIAGISGVVLLISMFLKWYSVSVSGGGGILGNTSFGVGSANAWESFGIIDLILFVVAVVAIANAILKAMARDVDLPWPTSTIVAAAGALAFVLILFRLLVDPVDVGDLPGTVDVDVGRGLGLFLGLISAAGIAYGGWRAMSEAPGGTGLGGGGGAGSAAAGAGPPPAGGGVGEGKSGPGAPAPGTSTGAPPAPPAGGAGGPGGGAPPAGGGGGAPPPPAPPAGGTPPPSGGGAA